MATKIEIILGSNGDMVSEKSGDVLNTAQLKQIIGEAISESEIDLYSRDITIYITKEI